AEHVHRRAGREQRARDRFGHQAAGRVAGAQEEDLHAWNVPFSKSRGAGSIPRRRSRAAIVSRPTESACRRKPPRNGGKPVPITIARSIVVAESPPPSPSSRAASSTMTSTNMSATAPSSSPRAPAPLADDAPPGSARSSAGSSEETAREGYR